MADDPKKPYGDVQYADPGYQEDGKKRYPLDSEEHCRAAWSYINMPENAAKYSSEHLQAVKSKIKAALKRYGAEVSADKKENRSEHRPMIETRSANMCDLNFDERIITVMAVPYEQSAQVMYRHEVWNEVFARSALKGFDPQERRVPVTTCLQVPDHNHSGGELVGRIIQTYPDREDGFVADLKISHTDMGQKTLELARDQVISPSIGFMVKNPYQDEVLDRRSKIRRVTRAFIDHLAFVAQPAYPGAKVLATRSDGMPEADFPPAERPIIDDFLDDPLFQWASQRINHQ